MVFNSVFIFIDKFVKFSTAVACASVLGCVSANVLPLEHDIFCNMRQELIFKPDDDNIQPEQPMNCLNQRIFMV